MREYIEIGRNGVANFFLNRAYEIYFAELEPQTVYFYLPERLRKRAGSWLAEKIAKTARKGIRRTVQHHADESSINQWDNTNKEAAEIVLNMYLINQKNPPSS